MTSIIYFEIQSSNPEREVNFYSEIFGWKFTKVEGLPFNTTKLKLPIFMVAYSNVQLKHRLHIVEPMHLPVHLKLPISIQLQKKFWRLVGKLRWKNLPFPINVGKVILLILTTTHLD